MRKIIARLLVEVPRETKEDPEKRTAEGLRIPPSNEELNTRFLAALLAIATNAWRAKTKMVDPLTGEPKEEHARIHRHVDAIYRSLEEAGIKIKDHTGDAYDHGQPMKVIATEVDTSLKRPKVKETLLPTLFLEGRIAQHGEVVVVTPEYDQTQTNEEK